MSSAHDGNQPKPNPIARILLRAGGGPPPGYEWDVHMLVYVFDESWKALNEEQFYYLADQVQHLAKHPNPTMSQELSIDKVGDFYELREKGGVLGKLNVRIFFDVVEENRLIRILGLYVKKHDGPLYPNVVERIQRRQRGWNHYGRNDR